MKQFRQYIYVNGERILGANNISVDFSLSDLITNLSFTIPVTYTKLLKKFDSIELYVGYVGENETIKLENLVRRFKGYITTLPKSVSKNVLTLNVGAESELEFFTRNELLYSVGADQSIPAIISILQTALKTSFPEYNINFFLSADLEDVIVKVKHSTNVLEILESIRALAVLNVYYNPMLNMVFIVSPVFAQYLYNDYGIEVYDFNLNNMIGTLNYGDLTNDVNQVVYVGLGGNRGVATDYSSVALGQGLKTQFFRNMTTGSRVALEKMARNKLLSIQKNHKISLSTPYLEPVLRIMPGELCRIADQDYFTGEEIFIINSVDITISKNDLKVDLGVFAHTLTQFPESVVLDDFGIAGEAVLNVMTKKNLEEFK